MLVAAVFIVLWAALRRRRGQNPPAAGPALQEHQVMQPFQETYHMQDLDKLSVLFLPKSSGCDPRRTYQACLVTREYITMAPHSSNGHDDDIFVSAAQENSKYLMYNKSLLVHGQLHYDTVQQNANIYTSGMHCMQVHSRQKKSTETK